MFVILGDTWVSKAHPHLLSPDSQPAHSGQHCRGTEGSLDGGTEGSEPGPWFGGHGEAWPSPGTWGAFLSGHIKGKYLTWLNRNPLFL